MKFLNLGSYQALLDLPEVVLVETIRWINAIEEQRELDALMRQ